MVAPPVPLRGCSALGAMFQSRPAGARVAAGLGSWLAHA